MGFSAAIVVHIYKENLTEDEEISLKQLTKILGEYPIYLVAPESLKVDLYKNVLGSCLKKIIRFSDKYFKNLNGYNKLLLSKKYYEPYLNYDYILLHHTDAFIFKDELQYWMDKNYDNIGAPIYAYNGTIVPDENSFICSGNGGLCLRRVSTFYRLCSSYKRIYKWEDIVEDISVYSFKGVISRAFYYFSLFTTLGSRLNILFNSVKKNEDEIWGKYVPKYFNSFKTATLEEGAKFSIEFNCEKLLKLNHNQLPFGCHGWNKEEFSKFLRPLVLETFHSTNEKI